MRKFLLCFLLCFLLTGCTYEADRIYVVCQIDNGTVSVFDGSGDFYVVTPEGNLVPSLDPNLKALPVLHLIPKEGDFHFEPVLPGLYQGTLASVNRYVYRLQQDGGVTNVVFASPTALEIYVHLEQTSIRIIYNVYGEVRIYSSNGETPLYLNEE